MQGDAGLVSLCEDGIISKWTRTVSIVFVFRMLSYIHVSTQGQNHWQWAKIVDAGTEHRQDNEAVCFAYMRDRIAVSFPKLGVKVWQWIKGTELGNVLLSSINSMLDVYSRHLAATTLYSSTECDVHQICGRWGGSAWRNKRWCTVSADFDFTCEMD
jgi:hypothetical protein